MQIPNRVQRVRQQGKVAKRVISSCLIIAAVVILMLQSLECIVDSSKSFGGHGPHFTARDAFNKMIINLDAVVAPIAKHVPMNAPMRYVGEQQLFEYLQAVMAPRKVSPDLEAEYLLVVAGEGESMKQKVLQHEGKLLFLLSSDIGVAVRAKSE